MMHLQFDRLFAILSGQDFLSMRGLANEVPIFIQPYKAEDELSVRTMTKALVQRLRTSGIKIAEIDLFQLLLTVLKEEGILDELLENEHSYDRRDFYTTLRNFADPKSRIVPRLAQIIEEDGIQLAVISGVGQVFPFLRAHQLLDCIQPAMMHHPLIMFFPGEYINSPGMGSQLRLFATLPSKGYYRAFNLNDYQPPTR